MKSYRYNRHKSGALEGLPLYLIIMVIIAAIAIAILVGFMLPLQKPNLSSVSIYANTGSGITYTNHLTFTSSTQSQTIYIVAIGTDGKAISGASVTVSGYGVDAAGSTLYQRGVIQNTNYQSYYTLSVKAYSEPNVYTYTMYITVQYTGTVARTISVQLSITNNFS